MHVYSIIQWDLVLYLCKMYSVLINFIECYFPPSHFFSALSFLSVWFFFSLFFLFLPHLETMCWIQTWCVNPLVVLSVEISRREVIKCKGKIYQICKNAIKLSGIFTHLHQYKKRDTWLYYGKLYVYMYIYICTHIVFIISLHYCVYKLHSTKSVC